MQELLPRRAPRPRRPFQEPAPPASSPPEPAPDAAAGVEVIWGSLVDRYEVAGMTVDGAFALLHRHLGFPRGARALVNGAAVEPTATLRAGDVLEFVRAAGERGGR